MTIPDRLTSLRNALRRRGIDAIVIPSSDPHLSEYLPPRWQGRAWISGFTGSAGTFVATAACAGVWTDARYWTQAEAELAGTGIRVMQIRPGAPAYAGWLAQNLPRGATVAVDMHVLDLAAARALEDALTPRGIVLRHDPGLLDEIWTARPALPSSPVFEHPPTYATTPRRDKLAHVRAAMASLGADAHFVSTLDDVAWLTNLRGADVAYNPVFLAHVLLTPATATLFAQRHKVSGELEQALRADGIDLAPYGDAEAALARLAAGTTLLLDPRRITAGMRSAVAAGVRVVEADNPSTLAKARKSDADLAHVRATMEQDGAALCEFFAWLDAVLADPHRAPPTEAALGDRLLEARMRRPGFVSPSFATIAGFGPNGALVHYDAAQGPCATVEGDGLLLIDSGAQYLGGTTDITRMVAVGRIDAAARRDCTLVLKGLIALSSARFPRGTRSPMLDAIARAPLWAAGIDYGHGTGHGVGYFLNVHEGPQSISANTPPAPRTAMEPGMITSIEPGVYRPGRWGVRIENLVVNTAAQAGAFGEFLRFETLTLCPIDTRCLDLALLRPDERAWLDAYHAVVRARLAPHVSGAAAAWLHARTAALAP